MATIVLKLRGRELSRHAIVTRITRIGRDSTNDIPIDNPGVSRVHASIRFRAGGFHVVDEGSANGIFINGEEVDTHELKDGDEIQFGKFTAVFFDRGGADTRDLLRSTTNKHQTVNPVETTSISTADLKRMIAERQATVGLQDTSVHGVTPPAVSPRHFETYTAPPSFEDSVPLANRPSTPGGRFNLGSGRNAGAGLGAVRQPDGGNPGDRTSGGGNSNDNAGTQQFLLVMVGAMAAALVGLAALVIFLLLRS